MGWLDRLTVRSRTRASSADPVADALEDAAAAGPLRILIEGEEQPTLEELPEWIGVDEDDEMDGFNTVVELDDEIHFYCDPADGLDVALAEQPGIKEAYAEDREVIYVRTRLHLEDVTAAVIRAVVETNRNPRPPALPPGAVTESRSRDIADAVAPQIVGNGFTRGHDAHYFHRSCGDGIVQVLTVHRGMGTLGDGSSVDGLINVRGGVCLPEGRRTPLPDDPMHVGLGDATVDFSIFAAPSPAAVAEVLETEALPWLASTAGREALATWVLGDPSRISPPDRRPLFARLLLEWGHPDAAGRILEHLDRDWPWLAQHADARAVRDALAGE